MNEFLADLQEELSRETIEEGKNEPYVEPEETVKLYCADCRKPMDARLCRLSGYRHDSKVNAPEEKPIEST